LLGTKRALLPVGNPIVVGLIVLVVLLEGVIQGTVQPVELGDGAQVEGHLRVVIRVVVVSGSDGVDLLVEIRVDDVIAPVVVGFLPIVLGEVRRVEVDS